MILVFFQNTGKMPQIARHQIVRAGRIRAFQEPIVVGIARHLKTPGRYNQVTSVTDELEKLPAEAFADFELGAGENIGVLVQDGPRYVKPRRSRDGQKEGGALRALGLECG